MSISLFDRKQLQLKPLSSREHDLDLSVIKQVDDKEGSPIDEKWEAIGKRIIDAKSNGASVVLMMGGHMFRSGVQNYIIDLMERGYISHLATNGSGMIHDYEYALVGATTEDVARYIAEGQFGLWQETGRLNDIINAAYSINKMVGMGEAVGKEIQDGNFPHKGISLFAAAYRLKIPMTVHVGIGYDIIHEHPNCDGAATGALSYNDFLTFAATLQKLENGVVMNFGSAVMGPEIFLKALSMVRNAAKQQGNKINNFTTVVCDLYDLADDYHSEPNKGTGGYYFRPWKTMLVRTVSDGGESFYVKGKHAETIPTLWSALNAAEKAGMN